MTEHKFFIFELLTKSSELTQKHFDFVWIQKLELHTFKILLTNFDLVPRYFHTKIKTRITFELLSMSFDLGSTIFLSEYHIRAMYVRAYNNELRYYSRYFHSNIKSELYIFELLTVSYDLVRRYSHSNVKPELSKSKIISTSSNLVINFIPILNRAIPFPGVTLLSPQLAKGYYMHWI